jgi:hypothetical protein
MESVLDVMTMSYSPVVTWRAIVFAVGQVVFSVEALNCDVAAVDETFGCERVEHTADAVVQNRLRGVLHDRNPGDPGSAPFTLTPVGDEQNGRAQGDEYKT